MYKQNILLMVRALYFCMEDKWAELSKIYNISPAQQHILFLLLTSKEEYLTPSQISELGCWHNSTVTRLLKPLQKNGFIRVTLDRKKPIQKMVFITHEGEVLFQKLVKKVKEMDTFPLDTSHLSEKEVILFLELGQKILNAHKGEEFMGKVVNAKVENVDYA